MNLGELWDKLTEPQAIILSSVMTVLTAIIGVVLGWLLFRGKVSTLTEVVEHTEKLVEQHRDSTTNILKDIEQQLASSLAAINTLRAQIADQSAQRADNPIDGVVAVAGTGDLVVAIGSAEPHSTQEATVESFRTRLLEVWDSLRAEIERLAADPTIDGRRRAKYARVDRRSYWRLLELMGNDEIISPETYDTLYEAYDIWAKHKTGRAEPNFADLRRMEEIRAAILPNG